ncbi:hypothetical protein EWM64_g1636 [Hericium alpestre]|uniref:Uncharacterized protein n=1 Tax=Hericium alpestre TaxID=135208 RepID=A0A4Z0AA14_9AGAM|nr:hypothetical protein EWM64_g1636 [Hericium alpestre]
MRTMRGRKVHKKGPTHGYKLNKKGLKIHHCATKWKLTERAQAAARKLRSINVEHDRPILDLPAELLVPPQTSDDKRPKLYCGLTFDTEQLVQFIHRHRIYLPTTRVTSFSVELTIAATHSIKRLNELCNTYFLEFLAPPTFDQQWIVGLYTNHDWSTEKLEEEDKKEMVKIIKRELNIDDNEPLRAVFAAMPATVSLTSLCKSLDCVSWY